MLTYPSVGGSLPISAVPPFVPPADSEFEPVLFLSSYYSDLATITASSEASVNTPATLMQTVQPSEKWRSAESSPTILLTFSRPRALNMLVLVATNLLQGDIIRVRAYPTSDMSDSAVAAFDTGARPAWSWGVPLDQIVRAYSNPVRWDNESEYLYWRIDIVCNNGQDYVEVGRLMADRSYQPAISCDFGSGMSFTSPDTQQTTDFQYTKGEFQGLGVRAVTLRFTAQVETEAFGETLKLRQLRGNAGDFYLDLFPWRGVGRELTACQAMFKGSADFVTKPVFDGGVPCWETSVVALEVAL